MELICNELSLYPLVNSSQEAENYFRNTLKLFEKCQEKYGFSHIRFPIDFKKQNITTTQTFIDWIGTITNRNLKDTIIKLLRPPFTDDLNENELVAFYQSEYKIIDETAPLKDNPIGLPVAHILSKPTISFNTHNFWQTRKINLEKTNASENENLHFFVHNICFEDDLSKPEFLEWTDISMIRMINTKEILIKYLAFTKYQVIITDNFWQQFIEWQEENPKLYKYILLLMKDVQMHPFTGGMGQTENLKNRGKEASKRITNSYPDGHRLSYTIENNTVTFIACKGHYEFH
ncbi:MAG: type II toxin-antitoxin system YoeB family toxin [Flavobacterium sp.]|nr:type II toxin-antitoxin system YoeB family toxin [Flavobacterium sp.]